MDLSPLQKRLPFLIALVFFLLAYTRPLQRSFWIIIACVFLVIGLLRSRAAPPGGGPTGG